MTKNVESRICEAALRLVAKQSWRDLTLERIASSAKLPLAQAKKIFPDKNKILSAIVRYTDQRITTKAGKIDLRAAPHDRLFQVMMARFDALQENRAGILSVLEACRRNPSLARYIVPAQGQSMQQMLKLARLAPKGAKAHLASFGLLAVYYRALWRWQTDQTRDMAGTMAVLDQGLRCAGKVAEIIFRDL